MAIYFKFKNERGHHSIPLQGSSMQVLTLKQAIVAQKKLSRGMDFDLVLTNTTAYSTDRPARNGLDRKVARVNFACDSQSGLRVRVYPSCNTGPNCKRGDDQLKSASDQISCYAAGCSCFGSTCNTPECCSGAAKEQKRINYSCELFEYSSAGLEPRLHSSSDAPISDPLSLLLP